MKKLLALVLAVMMLVPAFALADNVIKIGVFEPSTGDNGAGGKQEILGIQYANSLAPTVTIGGEEYKVELVIEDNQSVNDKAVTAAASLVNNGVSVVLGSYGSGVCMAAGDIFVDAEVPAIGVSCTNPNVTALCDYYWRICFLDPFQGSVMANFAVSKGCTTAYVLNMQGEDYGSGLANYFVEAFKALGGTVIGDKPETFPEGNSDFTAYINNAVNANADVFFAPCSTTYAALIIDQAAAQGVTFPIMAGDTWENSAILNAAKGKNVEVYCSTFFDENDDAAAADDFVKGFKAWLNADPGNLNNNGGNDIVAAVSALGFDAYNVALAAIQAADSADSKAIAEALPSVTYEGVTGSIAFDDIGDAKKDMAYIKYANPETGAFDFVKTQKVGE
ncbi:MAG: ABC transporter substrate-binding protein [Clostridia bacterium]|nr:ABC transporter substrate-binding protein [Clostridia bacterium]